MKDDKKFDPFLMDPYYDNQEPMESVDDESWLHDDEDPVQLIIEEMGEAIEKLYIENRLNELKAETGYDGPLLRVSCLSEIPSEIFEIMPHSAIEECRRVINEHGIAEILLPSPDQVEDAGGVAFELERKRASQPHRHTLLETVAHMVSGFVITALVVFFMFPDVALYTNLAFVSIVTGIKFIVNYAVRRLFTRSRRF